MEHQWSETEHPRLVTRSSIMFRYDTAFVAEGSRKPRHRATSATLRDRFRGLIATDRISDDCLF